VAVVSNSSPLIAFDAIGQFNILHALFSVILIPPAVAREVAPSLLGLYKLR
jgi:predicted nucleic acid-binding protein